MLGDQNVDIFMAFRRKREAILIRRFNWPGLFRMKYSFWYSYILHPMYATYSSILHSTDFRCVKRHVYGVNVNTVAFHVKTVWLASFSETTGSSPMTLLTFINYWTLISSKQVPWLRNMAMLILVLLVEWHGIGSLCYIVHKVYKEYTLSRSGL